MMKSWTDEAWEQYVLWQTEDKKTLNKINKLVRAIERNGVMGGEGHPEPLKGNLTGWYSRRVDGKNRLIYRIKDETLEILNCKEHYEDR